MAMSRDEVREKVITIVVDQLKISRENVTEDASLTDDLGADSLDTAEMALEIEEEFDVENVPEDQEALRTVGAVIDFVMGAKASE